MARVILERTFDPPLTRETLERNNSRMFPCLTQHNIRWVRSTISLDRRRMFCEFDAVDAESLRLALRTAKLRYDSVWPAETLLPVEDGETVTEAEALARLLEAF